MELTIEISDRTTHRLISEVFKIFLREVLGYPTVRLTIIGAAENLTTFPLVDPEMALRRIENGPDDYQSNRYIYYPFPP